MGKLFQFHGFNTAQGKWLNYLGKQKAKDAAVNILLNGGKKYNKERRGKTKTANNKRRRKRNKLRRMGAQNQPQENAVVARNETIQRYIITF